MIPLPARDPFEESQEGNVLAHAHGVSDCAVDGRLETDYRVISER